MINIRIQACLLFVILVQTFTCFAQVRVNIPWGAAVNLHFGSGASNPGPALPVTHTGFTYTTNACPLPGAYTVVNKASCPGILLPPHDAGHIFFGAVSNPGNQGYMMLGSYAASPLAETVYQDTVRNLCGNNRYLFWAGIMNAGTASCLKPSFTFRVETLSGQLIASFQTGNIGGAPDYQSWYPGYFDTKPAPPFPFYGGEFALPAGITTVIVKVLTVPFPPGDPACVAHFVMDNIILSPAGPGATVNTQPNPDGWVTAACYQGNKPVELKAVINASYQPFGSAAYVNQPYSNPAVQWQQSVDSGYTWTDIPGEFNLQLSHVFSIPDTFFIRVRTSEATDISNPGCSVSSNIIRVEVDGSPANFSFESNSPVCTDADLLFTLAGGASYTVTGPNGFFDDSPFPHRYNPLPADSGWYYASMATLGGCTLRDSVRVVILGPAAVAGPDTVACYGQTIRLHAAGGTGYAWTPVTGLVAANTAQPLATIYKSGVYTVKVTDQSGCTATARTAVIVKDSLLQAGIAGGMEVVCPADIANFKDSSNGKITAWEWDFNNGQTSQLKDPPAQRFPAGSGSTNYRIQLTVSGQEGCRDTASYQLRSVTNCTIAVPNAFSPNGDGQNDYFYPLNTYKAKYLLFNVYNRYGQLVFSTSNPNLLWDGSKNGAPQAAGIYAWTLRYLDTDSGKQVSQKGTVVLVR